MLRSKEGWGRARIQRTIAEGKNRTIVLNDPVSVHLVYLTAWLDRERTMQFRDDHYNLDAPLVAALDANRE